MKSEQLEAIIRGLLNDEGRPSTVGPAELMAVIALVVKGALQGPVPASRFTLSLEIGVSDKTAQRTLENLRADGVKWVETTSGKGRSNSNKYQVLLDRLPVAEEVKKTIVTESMRTLAREYARSVKPYGKKKRRFTKGNLQRMAFCLQRFLDRQCSGDEQLLRRAINFALTDERYRARAIRGPHMLRRDFLQIVAAVKCAEAPEAQKAA